MSRLNTLLREKRISYNSDGDWPEANRVGGLYELIKDWFNPNFIITEIGSCEGVSTELFAITCKYVYAIDPWEKSEKPNSKLEFRMARASKEKYMKRMRKYQNVTTINDFSEIVVNTFKNNSLDAVYIDGAHNKDSVTADINLWLPKIKKGGVLCGHDWSSKTVQHVLIKKFKSVDKIYKDDSWVIKL
jgi:hypothetical protein